MTTLAAAKPKQETTLKDLASTQLIGLLHSRQDAHEAACILSDRQNPTTTTLLVTELARVAGSTEQPFLLALTTAVASHLKRETGAGRGISQVAHDASSALLDVLEKTKPSEFEFRSQGTYWENTLYQVITALAGSSYNRDDRTVRVLAALAVPPTRIGAPGFEEERWPLRNDSVRRTALGAIGTIDHPCADQARISNFFAPSATPEAALCGELAATLIRECDPATVRKVTQELLGEGSDHLSPFSSSRDEWQAGQLAARSFQAAAGSLTPEQLDRLSEMYPRGCVVREAMVSAFVLSDSPRHFAAGIAEMAPNSPAETAFEARFFGPGWQRESDARLLRDSAAELAKLEQTCGTDSAALRHGARLYHAALAANPSWKGLKILVDRFEQLSAAGSYGAECRRNIANLLTGDLEYDSSSLSLLRSAEVTPGNRIAIFEAASSENWAHERNLRAMEAQVLHETARTKGTPEVMSLVLARIDALGASCSQTFAPFLRSVFDTSSVHLNQVHPFQVRAKALEVYGKHVKGSTTLLLDCLDGNDSDLHPAAVRALKHQLTAAAGHAGLERYALRDLIKDRLAQYSNGHRAYTLEQYIDVLSARSEASVARGWTEWSRMDWELCSKLAKCIPTLLAPQLSGEDPIQVHGSPLLQMMKLFNEAKYTDANTCGLARRLSSADKAPYHNTELARTAVEHLTFAKDAAHLTGKQRLLNRMSFVWNR